MCLTKLHLVNCFTNIEPQTLIKYMPQNETQWGKKSYNIHLHQIFLYSQGYEKPSSWIPK